ncbi:MAG: L,D-transpeptidase [Acidiferrobacterales bacterium]|nr:L,D-transpeptidase [Acidiferrobacterales bacterium]
MYIEVHIPDQNLIAFGNGGEVLMNTKVSTARNGAGEQINSWRTPRGWHSIRAMIGKHAPENTVFVRRRPTGEIYSDKLARQNPQRDWILTRILWLSGLEPGFNRLGDRDTMRRFIYIHGCPDSDPVGVEGSSGCIKMRNAQILKLFELVEVGTLVYVNDGSST